MTVLASLAEVLGVVSITATITFFAAELVNEARRKRKTLRYMDEVECKADLIALLYKLSVKVPESIMTKAILDRIDVQIRKRIKNI